MKKDVQPHGGKGWEDTKTMSRVCPEQLKRANVEDSVLVNVPMCPDATLCVANGTIFSSNDGYVKNDFPPRQLGVNQIDFGSNTARDDTGYCSVKM